MADDIRIRVYPTVDKGQSASELSKVIADLEKNAKKIKVGIDDKELLAQIEKLKEQINSLTKGSNTKGNSKMFQGEAKSAKELVAEYKKLISEKDKLEKKMSKQTYQGQAYKALSKDLTKVNKDIESVGSKIDALNKKNIKSDITSSLNSSFESTIKKVTELGTSIENALGKRKLAGNQVADIKTLQNQVEKFKQEANLENILTIDMVLKNEEGIDGVEKIPHTARRVSPIGPGHHFQQRISFSYASELDFFRHQKSPALQRRQC